MQCLAAASLLPPRGLKAGASSVCSRDRSCRSRGVACCALAPTSGETDNIRPGSHGQLGRESAVSELTNPEFQPLKRSAELFDRTGPASEPLSPAFRCSNVRLSFLTERVAPEPETYLAVTWVRCHGLLPSLKRTQRSLRAQDLAAASIPLDRRHL